MNILTTIVATTAFAVSASFASATPTLSLTNPSTGDPSATVAPGGSFAIDVALTPDEPFAGFSLYLSSSAAGFSVISDTADWSGPSGNPLDFANNFTYPSPLPTTGNSHDFGFDAQNPAQSIPMGNYRIATLDLGVSGLMTRGTYTISSTPSSEISGASPFPPADVHNIPSATYSVIVAPEPPSLLLLVTGCVLVLLARRRTMRD